MKLNNRLKKILEFVCDNSFILDVGCDHALLDIYAVLNKKNIKAIASDIRKEPLLMAEKNIKKYNLLDKITIRQSNGIEDLEKEIDTIIISGMGAITINNIIRKDINKITKQKLILSPNGDEELVRRQMNKLGFKIIDEDLVLDKNIIYPILVFKKGYQKLTKREINYGYFLIKEKDELFISYYKNKLNKLESIKNKLPKKYFFKKVFINKKIREIKSIL